MKKLFFGAMLLGLVGLSGCMGNPRQGVGAGLIADQAYTEAYIEFAGPGERWGGPTTFALQITSKDEKSLRVAILPKGFFGNAPKAKTPTKGQDGIAVSNRGLASVDSKAAKPAKLNLAQMRDRLAGLSELIDVGSGNFAGCIYPIKVRMVRSDGAVKDWQGCRGAKGPSKGVSEFTNDILNVYAGI